MVELNHYWVQLSPLLTLPLYILFLYYLLYTPLLCDTQLIIYVVRAGLKWALRGTRQGWAQAQQAAV